MVIRQADGSLRGFLNNCRHRASGLLFEPAGNCGKTMTCPYHNWAYAIDGRLIGIPDRKRMYPEGFPDGEYGLVELRVEVAWGKFVFGCLSQQDRAVPRVRSSRCSGATTGTGSSGSSDTTASWTRFTRSTGRRS